jgi:hypothetical protein
MADRLHDWHDFYLLIGTASATLIGLMFVAASVGARFFDVERETASRAFLTPTVLHFSAVLTTCLFATAPPHRGPPLGVFLLVGGTVGMGYVCRLWIIMHRRGLTKSIDLADRSCYVFLPMVSYLILTGTAIMLLKGLALGLDVLALTLVMLLLLGIRNAWDMTLWVVLRTPNQ